MSCRPVKPLEPFFKSLCPDKHCKSQFFFLGFSEHLQSLLALGQEQKRVTHEAYIWLCSMTLPCRWQRCVWRWSRYRQVAWSCWRRSTAPPWSSSARSTRSSWTPCRLVSPPVKVGCAAIGWSYKLVESVSWSDGFWQLLFHEGDSLVSCFFVKALFVCVCVYVGVSKCACVCVCVCECVREREREREREKQTERL